MSPVLDLDAQIAALKAQRLELEVTIAARLHHGDDPEAMALTNYFENFDDRSEASQLNDMEIAQLKHEMAELRQVEDALQRIEAGIYGVCASCGENIAPERMRILPATRLCLSCQAGAEQHAHGPHGSPI